MPELGTILEKLSAGFTDDERSLIVKALNVYAGLLRHHAKGMGPSVMGILSTDSSRKITTEANRIEDIANRVERVRLVIKEYHRRQAEESIAAEAEAVPDLARLSP